MNGKVFFILTTFYITAPTNVRDYFLNNYLCAPFVEIFHNFVVLSTPGKAK